MDKLDVFAERDEDFRDASLMEISIWPSSIMMHMNRHGNNEAGLV